MHHWSHPADHAGARRARRWRAANLYAGLLAMLALSANGAEAAPPDNLSPLKSQFTTLSLAQCEVQRRYADGNAWLCPGLPGYPIYLAEGDQRIFMGFGPDAQKVRAASQTLGPFNSLFKDKRSRFTVEWRYVRRHGRDLPHAAIVRFFTTREEARGQVLVVTHIRDAEACHMAYIDAVANAASAIALARSIADEGMRSFDCRSEPKVYGATGRSPL